MKTANPKLANVFTNLSLSVSEAPRVSGRLDQPLASLLVLSFGFCLAASVGAQEEAPATLAPDQHIVRDLVELRGVGGGEADVATRAIDQLDRDRREIDTLHGEVAALRKLLQERGITAIASPSPTVSDALTAQSSVGRLPVVQVPETLPAPPAADSVAPEMATGASAPAIPVRSITLSTRDITRPEAASGAAVKVADDCGRVAAATGPSPLPVLVDQAAADNYRNLLAHPGEVSIEPNLPTTDPEGLMANLRPLIGQPMNEALVQTIIRTVTAFVSAHTDNLVDVYVPPQQLRDGNLVVVLAAAQLGSIRTNGQKHISAHDLTCRMHLHVGDVVNLKTLANDLVILNTSPWRQVSSSLTPSTTPGHTDLVLQTADRYPLGVHGSWDNTGTSLTGLNRWHTGVNWGDAFGVIGSGFDYSFTTSGNPKELTEHTLLYTIPTSDRDIITFTGDYSSSDIPIEGGLFRQQGRNIQAGAQWTRQLGGKAPMGSQVTAGFEYKRIGNQLLFNSAVVTNAAPNLYLFYVGAQVPWVDRIGSNSLNARFTFAPGFESDAAFNAARAGATSDYRRINMTYDRYVNLAAGFSLHGRFNGQWANGPLIASEQLQISGAAAVRGYREDALTADSGYVINIEALTPTASVPIPLMNIAGQLQGVAFIDFGQAFEHGDARQNVALGQTANKFTISSAGVGARFAINQNMSIKTDVGWHLRGAGSLPGYIIHGSLVVAY
ncbi:BamA/TamA family outer membrane protein [Burkholderia sp. JSH-S8]|nr:BamA/TamA family outer membrane protein [Burkholderia sp. JSH-S8]